MEKAIVVIKPVEEEDWYRDLIEDCQRIIAETIFGSRWTLIEGYHILGTRILKDNDNFKRAKIYGEKITSRVSLSLRKSQRTIERAIQFAKKYPDPKILQKVKNITWHKICNKFLPKRKKKIKLPKGKYGVIYADPPWPYPERLDSKNLYGAASYHYDRMSIKEICNLKVKNIAHKNSVLFLWVATNFLEESFKVIKSWGFEYKSNMVWIKERGRPGGIGWYVWGDHEILLISTRGSYLPKAKNLVSSVVKAPRGRHSKKPDKFYEIIEYLYPKDKYIELFLRGKPNNKNWKGWGLEAKDIYGSKK